MEFDPRTGLEVLDPGECMELLANVNVGRLAAYVHGQVEMWPVNYAVKWGSIFIRTDHGTKMAAVGGQDVVFEVDDVTPQWRIGWSVIVRGQLVAITDPTEVASAETLGLRAWSIKGKPLWLRLPATAISGRRIVKQSGEHTD